METKPAEGRVCRSSDAMVTAIGFYEHAHLAQK